MYLTLKISVTDTSLFTWVRVLKTLEGVTIIRFIFFNLMQISYLVGVGLLLNFELLACVHSQGMLYHNSVILCFSAKILCELVSVVESWEIVSQLVKGYIMSSD